MRKKRDLERSRRGKSSIVFSWRPKKPNAPDKRLKPWRRRNDWKPRKQNDWPEKPLN